MARKIFIIFKKENTFFFLSLSGDAETQNVVNNLLFYTEFNSY